MTFVIGVSLYCVYGCCECPLGDSNESPQHTLSKKITLSYVVHHNLFLSEIGSTCTANADCDTNIPNSKCDTDSTGRCICKSGFTENAGGDACSQIGKYVNITGSSTFNKSQKCSHYIIVKRGN